MNNKQYYVYILSNNTNVAIYIGVTSNLKKRIYEHKEKYTGGYTKRYAINKLVYYEILDDPEGAIRREKQLKGTSRKKKNSLVKGLNPEWKDLYPEL